MAFYPTAGLQQTSTRTGIKKSLRTETEIGYVFSRSQMLPKQKFTLEHIFTNSECNTLETFFYANQGSIFNLIYDSVNYDVIFVSDEFSIKKLSYDTRQVSLELREV